MLSPHVIKENDLWKASSNFWKHLVWKRGAPSRNAKGNKKKCREQPAISKKLKPVKKNEYKSHREEDADMT